VARTNPDFVLMDIQLAGMDGLTCLDRIRKRHPAVKVIMFSASESRDHVEAALRRGAVAYIVKSVKPVDLASAIRQAHDQTVYHAYGLELSRRADGAALDLTEREVTMLTAVARGLSNQAISKELWVSEQTVKFHLTNIYRKLGVRNRTAAARLAHEQGLVDSSA
jgi:DNA-binding NarL/FixJ family response regulator